jgi:pilus assembly protein CpaE
MFNNDKSNSDKRAEASDAPAIAPVPRVSIQAFCESHEVAATINEAINDRRMVKAHVKVHMGGAQAALEAYREAPTPNVLFIESTLERAYLLEHLDGLSVYCDAGTKVVVAGQVNDIVLYRELMARGISEYLVTPLAALGFVKAISDLYGGPNSEPLGRIIAVTGAKGGVGASTIAHNLAWAISRGLELDTVIADFDLGFGTAGLDFNQDPPQNIADALFAPDRLDSNLVDRLISKCSDRLSLLAAPATLDRSYDFGETSFDALVDILRASFPMVVLDVPHVWTGWSRRVLVGADDVVVVAGPDLANLRNAKSLLDVLRSTRPNDAKPKLVVNGAGVQKRPEITVSDFVKSLDSEATAVIPFDPKLFGTAANNGQMIAEVESSNKINESFDHLARIVTGRSEFRKSRRMLFEPIIAKLGLRKAS